MPRHLPALLLLLALTPASRAADPATPSFRRDIAPLLLQHCLQCHGPEKSKGNYRLDTFTRLLTAGESKSPAVTPRHPDQSTLYRLLTTDDEDDRMPQKADPLPGPQIALIKQWIEQGAPNDAPDPHAPLASIVPPSDHPPAPETYRHPVPVTALAFSPDGKRLAASGYREVTLWDPADGRLLARIPRLAERTTSLAFSPDGKTLAVAGGSPGRSGELRLCDPAAGAPTKTLDRTGDVLLAVAFSPDGKFLAAAGADNIIRLYDPATGQRKRIIEQHADWVTALAFSPDSTHLASASRDKSARVFDVATGAMQSAFLDHPEPLTALAWAPDGKSIFTAALDRRIRQWNPADGKQSATIPLKDHDATRLIAFDKSLYTSASDGSLRQYTTDTRELRATTPPADHAHTLALDPTHHRLATGHHDGQIRVYPTTNLRTPSTTFTAAPGLQTK